MVSSVDADVQLWLESQCGRAIAAPIIVADAEDDADMLATDAPPDALDMGGIALMIVYENQRGERTERPIRCRRVAATSASMVVYAFCEMRREPRSFRVDRIAEVIELDTGEVRTGLEYFTGRGVYFGGVTDLSLTAVLHRGLKILMAVARADGKLYSDEMEAVIRWVDRTAAAHGTMLDDSALMSIGRRARAMRPEAHDALSAIERVRSSSEEARSLARAIRDIINADGRVCEAEMRLIAFLEDRAGEFYSRNQPT